MVVQYCTSKKEEWTDKVMCRLQRAQLSLPKRRIFTTKHGPVNRFCSRKHHVFLQGWIQLIQSY